VIPPKDEVTICFAHVAYNMHTQFAKRETGIRSFQVWNRDELDARAGEADVLVISGLWRNDLTEKAQRLRFIQSIGAGTDQFGRDVLSAKGIRLASASGVNMKAVSEHAMALILALARRLPEARDNQARHHWRGMIGDLTRREDELGGKTLVIVGVGNIGSVAARIARGFGCQVLGTDPVPRDDCRGILDYVGLDELLERSDIMSLHCPLNETTHHLIGSPELARMKTTALLINTSRGAVIDTPAVVKALESSRLGGLAMDVYEREGDLFFLDRSGEEIADKQFERLLAFSNVLVTPHQGFFTAEALAKIASATIENIDAFERSGQPRYEVHWGGHAVDTHALQRIEA